MIKVKVITDKKDKYIQLERRYKKGIIKCIYGSEVYAYLTSHTVMFRTDDNLWFVKNVNTKPLSLTLVYKNKKDIPSTLTYDSFVEYHYMRNPNMRLSNEYWLYRTINEDNDNLPYIELKTENNGNAIRQLTNKETEFVNKSLARYKDHFDKRLKNYWNRFSNEIFCVWEKDLK